MEWANANGCAHLVTSIPDTDYYFVGELSTYAIGPGGGPMYREWDFEAKNRLSPRDLDQHLERLKLDWSRIVGEQLGRATRPIKFTGKKARRLLVYADGNVRPMWGDWYKLSQSQSERREFTRFRSAINEAIAPHEIDHVDFTTDTEQLSAQERRDAIVAKGASLDDLGRLKLIIENPNTPIPAFPIAWACSDKKVLVALSMEHRKALIPRIQTIRQGPWRKVHQELVKLGVWETLRFFPP